MIWLMLLSTTTTCFPLMFLPSSSLSLYYNYISLLSPSHISLSLFLNLDISSCFDLNNGGKYNNLFKLLSFDHRVWWSFSQKVSTFLNVPMKYSVSWCRKIKGSHCQSLGNGMWTIPHQPKDSLSFSAKLVTRRRPRKHLVQALIVWFHLRETKTPIKRITMILKTQKLRYFYFFLITFNFILLYQDEPKPH